ncbi:MAG: hypothetical protein B7X74_00665 [Thiotrichales bacterium 39-47-5]|nr:MAG: hypothetical protein B7X74_00665 [Thiotrichales bacterium 39-47-5]
MEATSSQSSRYPTDIYDDMGGCLRTPASDALWPPPATSSGIKVSIDESLMDDREMLEDLIAAAINSANRKVEQVTAEKMGSLTAGLPAGLGNIFG